MAYFLVELSKDIEIHPNIELIIEIVGEELFDKYYQEAMNRYKDVITGHMSTSYIKDDVYY